MSEAIRLTHEEINSPAWKKIKAWSEQGLAQLRVDLEADQTPERTQKIRGSIRSLKILLALEDQSTPNIDDELEV